MAKLTYEDKKEIIRLYTEEHMGYKAIACMLGVSKRTPERIIRKYKIHGTSSLLKQKKKDST